MKLLICGDSYSYDHNYVDSWVTLLSKHFYSITNLSQCGVGEYKILKQLKSVNLNDYYKIIIFHTSPNRVHIDLNTMYEYDSHKNADLIFLDVSTKKDKHKLAQLAYDYFVEIFDVEYYAYIHSLICKDINMLTKNFPVIHATAFDYKNLYNFDNNFVSFYNIQQKFPGNINHLNKIGNLKIYKELLNLL